MPATVKELREALSNFNDDDKVYICTNTNVWSAIDISSICKDICGDIVINTDEMR